VKIQKNAVVTIHYTLKDESGKILDSSRDRDPLDFLQGAGQIIPGMEKALDGRGSGEEFSVVVEPEEGYGVRDETLIYKVPREHFESVEGIEVGMQFQVDTGEGPILMNVAGIEEDGIVLDGNHPLADERLFFDVSILDVREATEAEIKGCGDCSGCCGCQDQ